MNISLNTHFTNKFQWTKYFELFNNKQSDVFIFAVVEGITEIKKIIIISW